MSLLRSFSGWKATSCHDNGASSSKCVGLSEGSADSTASAQDAKNIGQSERRFARADGGAGGGMERRGYLEARRVGNWDDW